VWFCAGVVLVDKEGMMTKILIVDDEVDAIDFMAQILKREGFEVFTVDNGKDAISVAEKEHPNLILLDINMPDIDGGEVSQTLSENELTEAIPVIFLTGMITKEEEGYIKGHLFISKSSNKDEIIKKIKDALGI
jgi:CheY-like chemotaxis protein